MVLSAKLVNLESTTDKQFLKEMLLIISIKNNLEEQDNTPEWLDISNLLIQMEMRPEINLWARLLEQIFLPNISMLLEKLFTNVV